MMRLQILAVFLVIINAACQTNKPKERAVTAVDKPLTTSEEKTGTDVANLPGFYVNGKDTLVRADHFNKDIFWDLKYATADNFMGRVLYDTLKAVYVQKDVAERLAKCQEFLARQKPGFHLLVYDGVRPLSVQQEMWDALDTIPVIDRGKFVSNPRNGSVHNYGAAVDITICDHNRVPLDMGAGYDDIRKIAYPSLEAEFLASGELTAEHVANRELLRKVMRSQGFNNIPSEWWHFNSDYRRVVKQRYAIVKNELR